MTQSVFDFKAQLSTGEAILLSQYKARALLIVNVASLCGFTSRYALLERWFQTYKDRGLTVLAFPCDQFGKQEPGSNEQIRTFCQQRFGVSFPVMAKVDVKGDSQHPLFRFLTQAQRGLLGSAVIKWNFTQFLCDRRGQVVGRFSPLVKEHKIIEAIERVLDEEVVA